jgi:hypothetical protein
LRNPKLKKQNVRATGAPVADVSRLNRALALDYSKSDPSATVCVGRTTIGYLIDGDRECTALTPGRELIGIFPDRKSATYAVLIHPRRASQTT